MVKIMGKRFKIIDTNNGCFLTDTTHKLVSIPLEFRYEHLSERNKRKLQEWLDFLNAKNEKKRSKR